MMTCHPKAKHLNRLPIFPSEPFHFLVPLVVRKAEGFIDKATCVRRLISLACRSSMLVVRILRRVLRVAERRSSLQGYYIQPRCELWRGVFVAFDEASEFFVKKYG
ncbi:hypothetical protein Q31b_55580 [Novipirellula aureliae]|uniref:Uncharacterized protein n=1 Tax=Novipirellula aureliae TaxID=2527966 RepID=A0A5C6DBN6_9BACT|nr:hypothetical protein Q31b_55580 [Novipirellula aureliae]